MPLTLIGPRGSGKSTVGRLVAGRLGRPFADADEEIERAAGRTVAAIFAAEGEAGFRAIEETVMADLLTRDDLVLAAGGGAVLSARTRARLAGSGQVVYLRVSAETAATRVAADPTTAARRPALTNLPPATEFAALLAIRGPLYESCATLTLDADRHAPAELADAILHHPRFAVGASQRVAALDVHPGAGP